MTHLGSGREEIPPEVSFLSLSKDLVFVIAMRREFTGLVARAAFQGDCGPQIGR